MIIHSPDVHSVDRVVSLDTINLMHIASGGCCLLVRAENVLKMCFNVLHSLDQSVTDRLICYN